MVTSIKACCNAIVKRNVFIIELCVAKVSTTARTRHKKRWKKKKSECTRL